MRLDGKVALITGAGGGMGEVEARLFAREGARVIVADVLEARVTPSSTTSVRRVARRCLCTWT